ncbi:hypothetical protein OOK60_17735 [Trichothermofontia sichuanensis B231]|uniref:CP12 domain-containing protein n=1 Tax=Trichothermofontia sichuanensis TaxID=3045816 RepID=UPI00224659B8|nr:hypothetical protein OOK60_17735 [Trichothermofontia sichuanensis B231]
MLEKALKAAIADARSLAAQLGEADEATQAAWETVNEMEVELAFCKGSAPTQSAVDQFREPIKPISSLV